MILITGGAGYIGSHTVKHLIQHGYECLVIDNLSYGHKEAVHEKALFLQGDILDEAFLRTVFSTYSIEAVVHFAAFASVEESTKDPQKYYTNNVIGTLTLLKIMRDFKVDKIVFSSTCATYGNPQYLPLDENHPQNPVSAYGWTKLMVEQIFKDYHQAYGLKYIALRYFNACGADSQTCIGESHMPETHLIPCLLQALSDGRKEFKIFGTDYDTKDGTCVRDYIHVEDLALAHRLALEKIEEFSGTLNLGTGIPTTVKEIFQATEKVTGRKYPLVYADRRAGDAEMLYASNSKIKEVLGWQPRFLNIEDMIETAWNWEQNRKF